MLNNSRKNILIISHDKIGPAMAGPGIRYHFMAEVLSKKFNVTIGFFDPTNVPPKKISRKYSVKHIDAHTFHSDFEGYDIIIALWLNEAMIDYCNRNNMFIVFDVYAPVPVENLAASIYSGKRIQPENDFEFKKSLLMYRKFFENGDLFLFSNRRQIDFWVGYVFGSDQVRLSTYNKRPFFERFILAPMGIDIKNTLEKTEPAIKGVIPSIKQGDKLLLWTGGIWDWFDGKTLIQAMKIIRQSHPSIKLVFFGTKHPNPSIPEMKESLETRKLAEKLGIINKTVFFMDGWVEYSKRINYLLEATAAVNTHKSSVEMEFSHRTRVLDHLLVSLPTIATEGDYISDEIIKTHHIGYVVPPKNPEALAKAIIEICEDKKNKEIRRNIQTIREQFSWEQSLAILEDRLSQGTLKLSRLAPASPQKSTNKAYLLIKRITPPYVKKAVLRALHYVK